MSEGFTRTPTGIVGKWHFYQVPTIWVEGPTDVFFYTPVVDDLSCRIEAFHGTGNAAALIDGLINNDLPYLIILDGDYTILGNLKAPHKRVIRLKRYSFENYLWELEPINRACHRSAQSGDRTNVAGPEYERITMHLNSTLREIVELDVAGRNSDPAPKVLPDRVERLLADPRKPEVCPEKVQKIVVSIMPTIPEKAVIKARSEVDQYLRENRLVDLLKGHILFGVLRLLFTRIATQIKGSKVIVDDEALTQLLADAVWRRSLTPAHKKLKTDIRKHVRNLLARFPAAYP